MVNLHNEDIFHKCEEIIKVLDILHILCYNIHTYHCKTMINLDERYHSYLDGSKKMRIDGIEEKVKSYGWHCDGNDIMGHYVTTENYKLFYNMDGLFTKMVALRELSTVA